MTITKGDEEKRKERKSLDDDSLCNYVTFLRYYHNLKTHIAQVDSVLLGGLIDWSVQDNCVVLESFHGLGFVLGLEDKEGKPQAPCY